MNKTGKLQQEGTVQSGVIWKTTQLLECFPPHREKGGKVAAVIKSVLIQSPGYNRGSALERGRSVWWWSIWATTMASLTHMATLVRLQEVLMLGWINTGRSTVAIRARECGTTLIKCSEEKRLVKILIIVCRTRWNLSTVMQLCILNHNNEKRLASITQCRKPHNHLSHW